MAIISESVELQMPGSTARARWSGYINEMIMTSEPGAQWSPFAWLRVECEADHDMVQFEHVASGATRMTVALAYPAEPDDGAIVTSIRSRLQGDLACFREGAENGHRRAA